MLLPGLLETLDLQAASDLTLGEPFGALESGECHPWMR
jgi:hypothetical protein